MASKKQTATGYEVDYGDKRFKQLDKDKNAAIKENDELYDGMINQSAGYFSAQTDAINDYAEKQQQLQQDRTDFEIEQIEQEKEEARQDFEKESAAAYADWQKAKDDYGTNAERMAESGLASSGYSESSQVAMYNQYQRRVATAKESLNKAVVSYNNAMTEARLQNDSAKAEIAFNTLLQSLQLSLQGFQYKNDLLLQKTQAKRQIDDTYYGRHVDLVSQINTENSLAESMKQYNQNYQLELKQLQEERRQFDETMDFQKKKSNVSSSGRSVKKSGSGSGGGGYNLSAPKPKNADTGDKRLTLKEEQKHSNTGNNKTALNSSDTESILKVDKNSITSLGYGPISASKLNSLIASGEVIEYEDKGVLKYKRAK